MTSKEELRAVKIKCHPNANPNPMIDEALDNIEKDLARLEKQDKILDILKHIIEVVPNTKYTSGPKYYIKFRQDVILDDETKEKIKEWLNNDSSYL